MAYKFTFDITKLPVELFEETEKYSQLENIKKSISNVSIKLVKAYKINNLIGLTFSDSVTLVEDIIKIHIQNRFLKRYFVKTKKRAIFLPHCCRKYMDSQCKAEFLSETSTYICMHCSIDCMVSQATKFAKKENYDVFILPGASCVSKIFKIHKYDGIIGIACTDELKLGSECLMEMKIPAQGIPLMKNGCSGTKFDIKTLKKFIIKLK